MKANITVYYSNGVVIELKNIATPNGMHASTYCDGLYQALSEDDGGSTTITHSQFSRGELGTTRLRNGGVVAVTVVHE